MWRVQPCGPNTGCEMTFSGGWPPVGMTHWAMTFSDILWSLRRVDLSKLKNKDSRTSFRGGCSVTQLCPALCDPMNCSIPGFPVLHHLPELAQIHVHWVSDAIQPSHSVISFSSWLQSFPASRSFPVRQLLTSGGQRTGASASASVPPKNIQGWFLLGLTGLISFLSKGLLNVFSSTFRGDWEEVTENLKFIYESHSDTGLFRTLGIWACKSKIQSTVELLPYCFSHRQSNTM